MATFAPCWDDKNKPAPTPRSGISTPSAPATAVAPQASQPGVKPLGASPGMDFIEHPGRRYRGKWPSAPPELECATVESSTSTGSDPILKLVRKLSRTCSSRASSILKRASWRPDKRMSWYQESLDGNADSCSRISSISETCDNTPTNDLDPLLGSRRLRSSVRFSSLPSRCGTLRSRSMGNVFHSCRSKLSKSSLRDSVDQMLDRESVTAASYFQLSSSEPPRLDVLHHLQPGTSSDDGFQTSLESALQEITERGRAQGYASDFDSKPSYRRSMTLPVRGKAGGFGYASEAFREVATEPHGQALFEKKAAVEKAGGLNPACPVLERPLGGSKRIRLKPDACIRRATEPQMGTSHLADNKDSVLISTPEIPRLVVDLGVKVDTAPSHSISNTVKLVYPSFQELKGRVKASYSHENAMNTLQITRVSEPVHDLAFYDKVSRSYILNPPCFLVDKELEELALSRGFVLVSVSRRWQALKGLTGAKRMRPGELGSGINGASVVLSFDEDYIVISIRRSHDGETPVFIEAVDEPGKILDVDSDLVEAKAP